MAFKAKISFSERDEKELQSIRKVEDLLFKKAKTEISHEDKRANVDGHIELLDSTRRICGKIIVQVKTVDKQYEGLSKYPCPTSLFAYAEATTEIVFLLAVDHSRNVVLFKHISRKLLNENRDKEEQETIMLHFDANEELRDDNVDKVLNHWGDICLTQARFLDQGESILAENEVLKTAIRNMSEYRTTMSATDILELQIFSDKYNELLNIEFKYIKNILFPNVWKRGVAIYSYTEDSLEYSLYNIKNGEYLPPIVQLAPVSVIGIKHEYDYTSLSCGSNDIKNSPVGCATALIKKHVEEFIKSKRIIPYDETFLIEYIHEFVEANWRQLHLNKYSELDVPSLIQHFQSKYPYIDRMPVHSVSGGKSIYINTVYEAIKCLSKNGYTTIPYPYPRKGSYGNTGMVYDFFSPSTALEKSKIVILNTIRAYQNFIQSEFPLLVNDLDAFYGGNLISVLVDYSNPVQKFIFHIYYFRSIVPSNEKIITIEDVSSSRIMQENNFTSTSELFMRKTVMFNGKEFTALRGGGLSYMTILFGKYNCLTYFYELLKDHFDNYFEKNGFLRE